ncbi:FtsX-like permease family protein [bacterium AH-315-E10]|nr:FtsX-like permease family protein [bacterium AH-315-E10]
MIQDQIKLPMKVAMGVVLQGIRIRLGRSIVTITGVICGIAFLMSILTGQMIKKGVKEEDAIRTEVKRIVNFTEVDLGYLKDKAISLVVCGTLSEIEMRVLEKYKDKGVTMIDKSGNAPLPRPLDIVKTVAETELATTSIAVILMGDGTVPQLDWANILARGKQKAVASTRTSLMIDGLEEGQFIRLSRELTKDDLAKMKVNAKKDRFRTIWIGLVSLLVTVIGITNAMLMSVTERFREIGTMKCLGALSAFIRQIFIIESFLMGLTGGLLGIIFGFFFSYLMYSFTYTFGLVWESLDLLLILEFGAASLVVSIVLSVVAALYPARVASKMVPADALRSTV